MLLGDCHVLVVLVFALVSEDEVLLRSFVAEGIARTRVGDYPVGILRLRLSVGDVVYVRIGTVIGAQSQVSLRCGVGDIIHAIGYWRVGKDC